MRDPVIIIGSGLGGLECGALLARHGCNVTVLERHAMPGGCLQTFRRGGCVFDTGFHYVGGMGAGESLRPLAELFGFADLPWHQLDPDCADEVFIGGEAFPVATGYDRFTERLAERFPREKENLRRYVAFLRQVGSHIYDPFLRSPEADGGMNDWFGQSAYDFLCGTISDPLLRKVLSGTALKMELQAETLPLYIFAQINHSFLQSAWRLPGGGAQIVRALVSQIEGAGGRVLTGCEVTELIENEGSVTQLLFRRHGADGEETMNLQGATVISDIAPAATLDLVRESRVLRRIYRHRIASLPGTYGMFTANITLKEGALPYLNRNLFVHRPDADLWRPDPSRTESVLVHFYPPEAGGAATHLDLLSPMAWPEEANYTAVKHRKAEDCLALVRTALPDLPEAVKALFTSSPRTWQRYTGTPGGAAYGLRKDWHNPMGTVLSPRTPLKNLLMTGQNLNLHGILGVSMTALLTCAEILGPGVFLSLKNKLDI